MVEIIYKGHLENIAYNTLLVLWTKETGEVNTIYDFDGSKHSIPI